MHEYGTPGDRTPESDDQGAAHEWQETTGNYDAVVDSAGSDSGDIPDGLPNDQVSEPPANRPVRRFNITRITEWPDSDAEARDQRQPERLTYSDRLEIKQNALVPIRFMCTRDVPDAEAAAALTGVADALIASGQDREIQWADTDEPTQGIDPDEYVRNAMGRQYLDRDAGYGPQLDIEEVFSEIRSAERHLDPAWGVLITGGDLNARVGNQYINFVFGATNQYEGVSVQSIGRMMAEVEPGPLRQAMVRRVLRHEVGHMLGLPGPNRSPGTTEENLGLHCTNPCTMRQALSIPEWAEKTVEEHNNGIHFCNECMADLDEVRDRFRPFPGPRQQ